VHRYFAPRLRSRLSTVRTVKKRVCRCNSHFLIGISATHLTIRLSVTAQMAFETSIGGCLRRNVRGGGDGLVALGEERAKRPAATGGSQRRTRTIHRHRATRATTPAEGECTRARKTNAHTTMLIAATHWQRRRSGAPRSAPLRCAVRCAAVERARLQHMLAASSESAPCSRAQVRSERHRSCAAVRCSALQCPPACAVRRARPRLPY
jgi:hypothetical protein